MKKKTYPLDLSAIAYPLMRTRKTESLFRFEATLDQEADPLLLKESLEETLRDYPSFRSEIVAGFFAHKLREHGAPLLVKEDDRPPLAPLRKEDTNGYPFRLAYHGAEIVFEVFHALTDGNVGAAFFSDLLTRYVGKRENFSPDLPPRDFSPKDAFLECGKKRPLRKLSLKRYNGESVFGLLKDKKNFRLRPRLLSEEMDLETLKNKAKTQGATLTEYVAAAYLTAILSSTTAPLEKSVSLFIPIDLRRFFPSKTLRNFVCFERIDLEKGRTDFSFSSVLESVCLQFREKITPERMRDDLDDVVTGLSLPIIKCTPLFIKYPVFKLTHKLLNKVRQTAILSNLGVFSIAPQTAAHVKSVRFFLNNNRNAPLNLAMLSYNGKCRVTLTCGLQETAIPETFFSFLRI